MKILRRAGIVALIVLPILFIAFLLLIPPLTLLPQEEFTKPTLEVQSTFDGISDPAKKLFVERGSYLVHAIGCSDCHTPQGDQGPRFDKYLSGGILLANNELGGIVSYNLTSDKETGIGGRTDEEILRALRSGLFHTGRQINHRAMPWASFTNMTEEDLRAIVAYLREVRPVRHEIPEPPVTPPVDIPDGAELFQVGDFGKE